MSESQSLLDWLRDPTVSAYAAGPVPAWLWSADASRILWANPAAAAIFGSGSRRTRGGYQLTVLLSMRATSNVPIFHEGAHD